MIRFVWLTVILGVATVTFSQEQSESRLAVEWLFQRYDSNSDRRLGPSKIPQKIRNLFDRIDANRDEFIDLHEDIAFRTNRDRQPMRRSHPSLAKGIVANRDIEYARVGDNSLRLDLYSPKEPAARRPLIVWVHGGGWRNGSKDRCPALRFLAKGYVVASINYRLSGVAIYPAQIHDCKAAIRWLRAHAEQYSIDPRRIGVWGSSAGGHLVALLGTSGGVEPLEGDLGSLDHSSRVQAVCDFFGPTDFLQMDDHAVPNAPFKHNAPDSPEALVIGGPIQENTKKVEAANPLTYVTPDDPPFFIVHGDKDPLVPLHQSQLLFDALKRAKVNVKLHVVEGGQHGFGRNSDVDKLVDSFFDKQLRANSK